MEKAKVKEITIKLNPVKLSGCISRVDIWCTITKCWQTGMMGILVPHTILSQIALPNYSLKSDGIMSREVFDWNCIYWRGVIEQAANGEYCKLCTDGKEHDFALIVARGHVKKIEGRFEEWLLRMYGMLWGSLL